ncbi:patronin isoform X8 [Hermetia illucens]|uniref:patronin isoform X8 n=1 Tax=Hermetia illucens TaxID=343691 RepID=UPI0018CC54C0|nr:patronin isoform X8 [Hermetia illucens]
MVLNLNSVPTILWSLKTIYEIPTVAVNDTNQARQRASVKWLLSKAFNNRVPENLKEPFYRDHENQEHLKPQIVVGLGNATLYCQTLSNLYSDPNYQSLNHWSILQTLARKGVPVTESPDMPLTETVLIQTNPIRLNAHMAVIEALMILYAKEISSGDRVPNAIRRISGYNSSSVTTSNYESALLSWVSHVCAALKKRIDQEIESGAVDENGQRLQSPDIPPVRDFQDLCDGVCLAFLISYYCPKVIPWTVVRINYLPAVEDSIHNVLLVSNFSQKHLPYSVFHMSPEDITYMRGSMKHNLVVLMADLFNLFEIHPAKCVCYPGMENQQQQQEVEKASSVNEHGICHRRGLTCPPVTPIPDLRSGLDTPSGSPSNRPPFQVTRSPSASATRRNTPPKDYQTLDHHQAAIPPSDEGFVVHKSRGITTLSSMQEPLVPARLRQAKEKTNMDTKADERGDSLPAGRPSNWEDTRRPSYAGRRSRRNSFSEESQLTIENFGGSQDQLNMIGRNYERDRERERKLSSASAAEPAVAVRSSVADARGTLQIGYDTDSGSEKQDRETEKRTMSRQSSMDNLARRNSVHSKEKDYTDGDATQVHTNTSAYSHEGEIPKRKTSFSTLPNTTTWQQQSVINQHDPNDLYGTDDNRPLVDASKLSTIRMKLEEKRRHIEQEKRKMEIAMSRHQEKVGKAAFLQAINKQLEQFKLEEMTGKHQHQSEVVESKTPQTKDDKGCIADGEGPQQRPNSLQDGDDKWEPQQQVHETKRTPEVEQADLEKYQQSIAFMNTNLQEIQQDIHRLATQQNQIQAQHLQAQQLFQAQQIANMLNQQYGSQQNLPSQYRPQQSFGSTPHLPQSYNSPNTYNSRPPSRDPYQQQPPLGSMQQPMQYINDHGQYISQQPAYGTPPQPQPQPQPMYQREVPPGQYMGENGGYGYGNQYYDHNQYQSNQFINRPAEYDDYRGRDHNSPQPQQFYLHENSPQPTQRRTWAQSAAAQNSVEPQPIHLDLNAWQTQNPPQKIDSRTWKSSSHGSFMLHQNGGDDYGNSQEKSYQNLFPVHSSPQHSRAPVARNVRENRVPIAAPPPDEMAPQSISFIGDEDDSVDQIEMSIEPLPTRRHSEMNSMRPTENDRGYDNVDINLGKLNISSGSRTYRIPSPSRPQLNANSFQNPQDQSAEKGFYISFDNEQPKRPKPPLRAKRSPKKERSFDSSDKREQINQLQRELEMEEREEQKRRSIIESNNENKSNTHAVNETPIPAKRYSESQSINNSNSNHSNIQIGNDTIDRRHLEDVTNHQQQIFSSAASATSKALNDQKESKAIIIGPELTSLDPNTADEMERKKEKIMLLSLQRRQQQEEAKARKEIEAMQRREREREKEEERAKKKEEQAARRQAILEAHKLKKAIEEAEREGKVLDRTDLMQKQHLITQATPKLRQQKTTRPRPKTIHVESGSVEISEASSLSSRGKKGSGSNLTESPDEYPSTSSTPIGRRGSYKNSREPTVERGRTLSRISIAKGSTLNFRGRKSNSLMNLCDTDSGLGRATPPRRAPSPGMGPSGRHLPSPSGPGSLPPGLMSKRRVFDDGSSDISSTPSSMMEYTGPKLYKQPAAKSNRGIILNAVEYCVYPGAVHREAKQKVLEKIARSEAKHFLILFRDAGCQFRALYSYWPENETILKLYGTGPSQVDEVMFDKFFKYNSGAKCFTQVHTKHLTVTIDAFTIHNSLWQGKKVNLPNKKDMALVV